MFLFQFVSFPKVEVWIIWTYQHLSGSRPRLPPFHLISTSFSFLLFITFILSPSLTCLPSINILCRVGISLIPYQNSIDGLLAASWKWTVACFYTSCNKYPAHVILQISDEINRLIKFTRFCFLLYTTGYEKILRSRVFNLFSIYMDLAAECLVHTCGWIFITL